MPAHRSCLVGRASGSRHRSNASRAHHSACLQDAEESEEDEAAHVRKRIKRLRLRRHPSAERFGRPQRAAVSEQVRSPWRLRRARLDAQAPVSRGALNRAPCRGNCSAASRCPVRQAIGNRRHRLVRHAGACSVREDVGGRRRWGREPQAGDGGVAIEGNRDGFGRHGAIMARGDELFASGVISVPKIERRAIPASLARAS